MKSFLLVLFFVFCFLGCEPPPSGQGYKFNVGQKVKIAVDGRPAIIVRCHNTREYGIKYFNDTGEYQYENVEEYELVGE